MEMTIYNMAINATLNSKPGLKKVFKRSFRELILVSGQNNLLFSRDANATSIAGFYASPYTPSPSLSLDTVNFYSGSSSVKATWNRDVAGTMSVYLVSSYPVRPGKTYKVLIRAKTDSFNVINGNIGLYMYNISISYGITTSQLNITFKDGWVLYEGEFTIPTGICWIRPSIWKQGMKNGESVWIDSIRFYPVDNFKILTKNSLKQISTKITSKLSFGRFLTVGLETSQTLKAKMNTLRGRTLHGTLQTRTGRTVLVLKQLKLTLHGLTSEHTLNLRTLKVETTLNPTVSIYTWVACEFMKCVIKMKTLKTVLRSKVPKMILSMKYPR